MMPFWTTQMCSINFAFPNICITPIPTPVGPVPVPIPYPSIAITCTAIPSQVKVLAMAMPTHNMMTITPMSNGDSTGVWMNPLSGMIMGPQKQLMGSIKTFVGGLPVNKMLGLSGQNGMMPGAFGMTLSPSQIKVMSMV
jgi:hypothetical protein|tara:strand:- start:158 stop:574 length:417 start_codon:yes stop_codon:yes gene_type:complete